jgi:hypothetical protein
MKEEKAGRSTYRKLWRRRLGEIHIYRGSLFRLSLQPWNDEERYAAMTMKRALVALSAYCLFSVVAYSDDFSRNELFGGYSFARIANPTDAVALSPSQFFTMFVSGNHRLQYLGGFKIGIVYNQTKNIGFTGEFGWEQSRNQFLTTTVNQLTVLCYCGTLISESHSNTCQKNDQSRTSMTLMAGPRFSFTLLKRLRPFGQVLAGWHKNNSTVTQIYAIQDLYTYPVTTVQNDISATVSVKPQSDNFFSLSGGVGIDLKLNRKFSLRLFEVELLNRAATSLQYSADASYRSGQLNTRDTVNGHNDRNWTNRMRFSFGALFHFGKTGK